MDIQTLSEKYFPAPIRDSLLSCDPKFLSQINEIRLRLDKQIVLCTGREDFFLSHTVTQEDMARILDLISDYSIYAYNKELAKGYITLKGGCRVGVGGSVISEKGIIKGFSCINSLNIRIPRQVKGCGEKIVSLITKGGFKNTLIVSPPSCGKTTLLRDCVRILSDSKYTVSLVDERSEIAFLYNGIPQNDVGIRTDILDGCFKAEGILMAIRSLAPEIIAVDEIGSDEDIKAIEKAVTSGVGLICTLHGENIFDVRGRNKKITDMFQIYIFLQKGTPGVIHSVLNKELKEIWQS